jgi:hypothetical protein
LLLICITNWQFIKIDSDSMGLRSPLWFLAYFILFYRMQNLPQRELAIQSAHPLPQTASFIAEKATNESLSVPRF